MKNSDVARTCLGNYILLGNDIEDLKIRAREIANEAKSSYPTFFNTERAYIEYEMRYVPAFDQNFDVLFNLQGVAAEEAGFQDEYRGFIILDVSKYLRHDKEDWFDISIKFFHDQGELWKFIFLVDMTNTRAGEEMTAKILSLLYCRVEDKRENNELANRHFIKKECKANSLFCSNAALLFLEGYLFQKEGSRDVVSTLLIELADKFGDKKIVNMKMINEHIESGTSVIRYMLSVEKYMKFLELAELYVRKEMYYDEKV